MESKAMKYYRKSEKVMAVQFLGHVESIAKAVEWGVRIAIEWNESQSKIEFFASPPNGITRLLFPKDWIVVNAAGNVEIYPRGIFEATYECAE